MKTLEIVHPAAKSLVDISMAQDSEVMPTSNSSISLAMSAWSLCVILWRDSVR